MATPYAREIGFLRALARGMEWLPAMPFHQITQEFLRGSAHQSDAEEWPERWECIGHCPEPGCSDPWCTRRRHGRSDCSCAGRAAGQAELIGPTRGSYVTAAKCPFCGEVTEMTEAELASAALAILPLVQLYDGTGRHYADVLLPIAVDNVLTPAYHENKAVRPACRDFCLDPEDARKDIGFVWMLPLDMSPAVLIPHEIAGALVQAVDAPDEACCGVRNLVAMFAGGWRA
jgi:hypothetical protein